MAAEVLHGWTSDAVVPLAAPAAAAPRSPVWRWLGVLLGSLLVGLLTGAGILGYTTATYAAAYQGRLLPGTSVAGVALEGMTPRQALPVVEAAVGPQLDRMVALRWRGRRWSVTPRDLGATSNAAAAVAAAAEHSRGLSWVEWARLRWYDERRTFTATVGVRQPRAPVERFVERVAARVDRPARDASLDASTGWVTITPERPGRRVIRGDATAAVLASLRGGDRRLALPVEPVDPTITAAAYDQVILLRQVERKVYLYQGGQISHSWTVAVGTGDYPTPSGQYTVTEKRYLPTWVNPDPEGWGRDLPAEIGPGPGNPLGVRALNWSAPGAIRFHGTEAVDTLGTAASHGCVRMSNADVTRLYDLVDVGAVIVSL